MQTAACSPFACIDQKQPHGGGGGGLKGIEKQSCLADLTPESRDLRPALVRWKLQPGKSKYAPTTVAQSL